ncbi:MAG TPA: hypothetical protein VGK17_09600 [Propionicimonas sp.]|jgi:hypothetical protein
MKRRVLCGFAVAVGAVCVVRAEAPPAVTQPPLPAGQSANVLSAEVRQAADRVAENLLKAAERMPADQYGFQVVPDIPTFAGTLGMAAFGASSINSRTALRQHPQVLRDQRKSAEGRIARRLRDVLALPFRGRVAGQARGRLFRTVYRDRHRAGPEHRRPIARDVDHPRRQPVG